ncbi:hypothetical protein EIP86_000096 [Pleurotus ostreatoroseus]|nr:hypothetical protein EIP86_000096 [Pleurotus ostreatoroseus]
MKFIFAAWKDFPRHIWYFVACNIFLAILANIFTAAWAWQRRRDARNGISPQVEEEVPCTTGKRSWRNLPAALLTGWRILVYRRRIPHVRMYVLELILTVIYMIALMIYTHVYITEYPGYYVVDWANDAGYIAAGQFPLATALAMKNGGMQILTGMSHEKLNLMHRVVSRAAFLLMWMHGFGWVGYEASYIVSATWIICGLVAGITFSIVFIVAWAPIRRRLYEWFVLIHNVLILCPQYIIACFVVWGFDRLVRWTRYTLLSNFFSKNSCRAHCELIDSDTIRVTTTRTFLIPLSWKYPSFLPGSAWQAGQHFFLAFPTLGPLESHPMTIANIPESEGRDQEIIWIVRTREGLTRRLKNWLIEKGGQGDIPLMLDGPYGAPDDITPYRTCIFIGGGSGVTYTMSRLRGLLKDVNSGKACARRIVWIWVIRDRVHLNWLPTELTKALTAVPSNIEFTAQVYVTAPSTPADAELSSPTSEISSMHTLHKREDSEDVEKCANTDAEKCSSEVSDCAVFTSIDGLEILSGRPDVAKILEETIATCPGPVSVDMSGPEALVATVRRALSSPWASASAVLRGEAPVIQLNVEDFTM